MALYHHLYEQWAAAVASRLWHAGSAIPTEAELAREHGVSVGTVRKAIDLLVADGIVERIQGKGTFVRRPTFSNSLFRFFRGAPATPVDGSEDSTIISREITVAPAEVASTLGLQASRSAIRIKRVRASEGRPLLYEDIWLPLVPFTQLLTVDDRVFSGLLYPMYETRFGIVVARAKEQLTVGSADHDVAERLHLQVGDPVVVIERTAIDQAGRPVECRRSTGPGAFFHYEIDVR